MGTSSQLFGAIAHGQQLTLVSDEVVGARNHHGELYGFERLSQLMQERPSVEQVAKTAIDFGRDDDITVLTVTRLAAKPDAATLVRETSISITVRQTWLFAGILACVLCLNLRLKDFGETARTRQ